MNFSSQRGKRSHLRLAGLMAFVALLAGCETSVLPPPVKIEFRDSLVGIGKVIKITNESDHHLYNVKVLGRNFKEASSASVRATDHLTPHSTVEVGWMEFQGWTPQPGESVEVRCDDYALPRVAIIP